MELRDMDHEDLPQDVNETTAAVVRAAMDVHTELGAGLLERAYAACLKRELERAGRVVAAEVVAPLIYKGERIDAAAYRIDMVVSELVIVEVKAVEHLLPVHLAQAFTYLKLTGLEAGLVLNFNVPRMKQGIRRVVRSSRSPRSSAPPLLRVESDPDAIHGDPPRF